MGIWGKIFNAKTVTIFLMAAGLLITVFVVPERQKQTDLAIKTQERKTNRQKNITATVNNLLTQLEEKNKFCNAFKQNNKKSLGILKERNDKIQKTTENLIDLGTNMYMDFGWAAHDRVLCLARFANAQSSENKTCKYNPLLADKLKIAGEDIFYVMTQNLDKEFDLARPSVHREKDRQLKCKNP